MVPMVPDGAMVAREMVPVSGAARPGAPVAGGGHGRSDSG